MKRSGVKWVLSTLFVGTLMMTQWTWGAGFQLYTEGSAEALGQAGAISARRDMLSNTWYNPAALAGSEKQGLSLGLTLVELYYTYDPGGPRGWQEIENDIHPVPHFNYVQPLSERWTGMLSVTVPYGLGTEWDKGYLRSLYDSSNRLDFLTTPVAGLPQEISLLAPYITPSIGYRVNDRLSLAAGVSVVYADVFIETILHPAAAAPPPAGLSTTETEFEGDGYGFGYLLAAHYQFNDEWSMGARFHSSVNVDLEGDSDIRVLGNDSEIDGDVRLPPTVTLGVSNRTFEKLTLGFDLVWTGWSTYDELRIAQKTTDVPVLNAEKDWDNVFSYRLGAEYQATDHWAWRCGYVYDESPVPDEFRGLELPGNDRHMFTVGAGYSCGDWGVDLAYCYILVKDGEAGSESMGGIGEFEDGSAHLLGLSYHLEF